MLDPSEQMLAFCQKSIAGHLAIGLQRLQDRGLKVEQVRTLLATRNQVVFSVNESRVGSVLGADEI